MAEVASYTSLTMATVPQTTWDEAWLALISWKGYLQAFPGHISTRVSARALENGDVRVFVSTVWEYIEQLEEWRGSEFSAEKILTMIDPPAYDTIVETLEDFST